MAKERISGLTDLTPEQTAKAKKIWLLMLPLMPLILLLTPVLAPLSKLVLKIIDPTRAQFVNRYAALPGEISAAFARGDFDSTVALAEEYVKMAEDNPEEGDAGEAIHNGNQYLGLVAMQHGDIEAARKYLIAAGHSKGSPQLSSYGPLMRLAYELALEGEKDVVIQYLNLVSKWWSVGFPNPPEATRQTRLRIRNWKRELRGGEVPQEVQWVGTSKKRI